MKIFVPSADDSGTEAQVAEHFGRAPFYTVVDSDSGEAHVEPNRGQHTGGAGLPATNLVEAGAEIVICSGLGRRAVTLFEEAGVQVYVGAQGTVQGTLEDYREGRLEMATDESACPGKHGEGEHTHEGCHE